MYYILPRMQQAYPPRPVRRRVRRRRRRPSPIYLLLLIFAIAIPMLDIFHDFQDPAGAGQWSAAQVQSSPAPAADRPSELPPPPGGGGGGNPKILDKSLFYDIQGDTVEALRDQMSQKGPADNRTGRRFDGFTRWTVNWNYEYKILGGLCRLEAIAVNADVAITLPRWQAPANASPPVRDRWNAYINALALHENGHRDHAVGAAQEVWQTLKTLAPTDSCDQLASFADTQSSQIVQKYAQQDVIYDQETGHGASQGAIFP